MRWERPPAPTRDSEAQAATVIPWLPVSSTLCSAGPGRDLSSTQALGESESVPLFGPEKKLDQSQLNRQPGLTVGSRRYPRAAAGWAAGVARGQRNRRWTRQRDPSARDSTEGRSELIRVKLFSCYPPNIVFSRPSRRADLL